MKVSHLNYHDNNGGAARAAYRIHQALLQQSIASTMQVAFKNSDDWSVIGEKNKIEKGFMLIRPIVASLANKFLQTKNSVLHSPALFPSGRVKSINNDDNDIAHLHWINDEFLSIADIGKIKKPIVWTLHDMWAFCGAEHFTEECRWQMGYYKSNRPDYESGFDINRMVWQRKQKHWQKNMQIVTPSNWLAKCVRESALMKDFSVSVIPNPIDCEFWQPVEKKIARKLLNLPIDKRLVLFGAIGGIKDKRKGFDLLQVAIAHLRSEVSELEVVILGQSKPKNPQDIGFPTHYSGCLHDDISLRILYSAADAVIVPSRIDNFPNVAVEAHACGVPVVAFNVCGLPDIIEHKKTGYLAKPFDSEDLANGIKWVVADDNRIINLGLAARARAEKLWGYDTVAKQYIDVYKEVLAN